MKNNYLKNKIRSHRMVVGMPTKRAWLGGGRKKRDLMRGSLLRKRNMIETSFLEASS